MKCIIFHRFLTGLCISNVHVEDDDDHESDNGREPINGEHDEHAEEGAEQRHPLVVILSAKRTQLGIWQDNSEVGDYLEGGSPTRLLGDCGVEDGKVDEGVSGHEEV